jgi:hypothetical protein
MQMSMHMRVLIRRLVDDLVVGNYAQIEDSGRAGRLDQEAIQRAILTYGRTLIALPESALETAHVYPLDQGASNLVEVELWTVEEGCSDLTLSVLIKNDGAHAQISIQDIHVL